MSQKVDEKIIKKGQDLVGEGVRNVREMERHVRMYVKDELFLILSYHHLKIGDSTLDVKTSEVICVLQQPKIDQPKWIKRICS